jgi:AhpD family alkylhydroperoxidase
MPEDRSAEIAQTFRHINRTRRDIYKKYQEFSKEIKKRSSLDDKVQHLILLSNAIISQCDMCIALHVQGAATSGASKDEIIDAAWLAVAMGGSPKMMYLRYVYDEINAIFEEEE